MSIDSIKDCIKSIHTLNYIETNKKYVTSCNYRPNQIPRRLCLSDHFPFPTFFASISVWYLYTLPNWYTFVNATNTLTAKRLKFFGIIIREYRDQIMPVIARELHWRTDNFSTGRFISPNPAITKL